MRFAPTFVLVLLLSGFAAAGSVSEDRAALEDLYAATNGDGWDSNDNWGSSAPLGDWHGIQTNSNGRVTRVDLFDNNLQGTLPDSFGDLDAATYINIKQNHMTGQIPATIGNLESVEWLLLGGIRNPKDPNVEANTHVGKSDTATNEFTGSIPPQIGNLQNLEFLEISGQDFSGTSIPPEIGNARNLWFLALNRNNLEGQLPASIGQLTRLRNLQLHVNDFTGQLPPELGNLANLKYLWLGETSGGENPNGQEGLRGGIPDEWAGMKSLQMVSMAHNEFSEPIPNFMTDGTLPAFRAFGFTWNHMTGQIPEFTTDKDFGIITLDGNKLTGTVPQSLLDNDGLIQLGLSFNDLEGEISSLANMYRLRFAFLYANNFSGSLPEIDPANTALRQLMFNSNSFGGTIPESHGQIAHGEFFNYNIANNFIEGPIPTNLAQLGLSKFRVDDNKFTFKDIIPIIELDPQVFDYAPQKPFGQAITKTGIEGRSLTLGFAEVSHPDNQYQWYSDGSAVAGATDRELRFDSIESSDAGVYTLEVSNPNADALTLTSEPITLVTRAGGSVEGDRQALEDLYAATNGDSWINNDGWLQAGDLGQWFGVETNTDGRVTRLDLFDNNLVGQLPDSFGNLDRVEFVNIKHNKLTGPLPPSIGNLASVEYLLLSGPAWSDPRGVPPEGRNHYPSKVDWEGNKFSGSIPSSIGDLPVVEYIDLSRNRFEGTPLPPEIGNLETLRGLYLNFNGHVGELPASWGNLVNLQEIQIMAGPHDYYMNDPYPDGYEHYLSGEIPASWGDMTALRYMFMHNNDLTGAFPAGWKDADELRALYFSSNRMDGFPQFLQHGEFPFLRGIRLSRNGLVGEFPDICGLNLGVLDVAFNDMTGEIPDCVFGMSEMIQMNLNDNQFSGTVPDDFTGLVNIRNVRLSGNRLSGPLPTQWPDSEDYSIISFGGNNFTGPIPEQFSKFLGTTQDRGFLALWLGDNRLSGELPSFMSEFPASARIHIEDNRFVFDDLLPVSQSADAAIDEFVRAPQKPFGTARAQRVRENESATLVYQRVGHPDNVYQWYKDGSALGGATGREFSIASMAGSDEGEYTLQVTNPGVDGLTLTSEPISVRLGDTGAFDKSLYSAPRSGFTVVDGVHVDDTAVYSTGYASADGSQWQAFTLTGDKERGGWVIGSASSDLSLTDIRYVAVYSCTWSAGWDCSDTWQVLDREN